jgi:hypothetical protein
MNEATAGSRSTARLWSPEVSRDSLFRGCQTPISMRFCPGQAGAEFALFSRLGATRGTTHRQRVLRFDFHAYRMRDKSPTKMVNCDHSRILQRRIISVERCGPAAKVVGPTMTMTARLSAFRSYSQAQSYVQSIGNRFQQDPRNIAARATWNSI